MSDVLLGINRADAFDEARLVQDLWRGCGGSP